MSQSLFRFALLERQDRSGFESGSEPLDQYFHTQLGQDIRRRITACHIAICNRTEKIAGYYTLSANGISTIDLPDAMNTRLPRYPTIPAVLLGRLAVDRRFRKMKLGSALLSDAVRCTSQLDIGVYAMIVEAKDDQAKAFYQHHGFTNYGSLPNSLIAPLHQLLKADA